MEVVLKKLAKKEEYREVLKDVKGLSAALAKFSTVEKLDAFKKDLTSAFGETQTGFVNHMKRF